MRYILSFTPVEAGLEVDSGSKGVHPDKHLGEEKAEENIPKHQIPFVASSLVLKFGRQDIYRTEEQVFSKEDFNPPLNASGLNVKLSTVFNEHQLKPNVS